MKNIERNATLSSELILDDVRCEIKNVNKEGEITYIKVFNIKGKRRNEILEELSDLVGDGEVDDMDLFNLFYLNLIVEFTDLIIDTEDLKFLLNEGNFTSRKLMQEINDMIYEIQFEGAMNNLANVRNISLSLIAQSTVETMEYAQDRLDRAKGKKGVARKVSRRRHFIK